MLKDATWFSAANSTDMSLQRVYLYSSRQAAFVLRTPMPYYCFHLSTYIFFFVCSLVCVNFCSFPHYSRVKLVVSPQNLFVSAKLNTFHGIMQNCDIFAGIVITSQDKIYGLRLPIRNFKFYTWKSLWGLNDLPPFWKPRISTNYPFIGYLRTEHW